MNKKYQNIRLLKKSIGEKAEKEHELGNEHIRKITPQNVVSIREWFMLEMEKPPAMQVVSANWNYELNNDNYYIQILYK